MLTKRLAFVVVAAFAVALAAPQPQASAAATDPYEVNVILSTTGPGAFLGKQEQTALRAFATDFNQRNGEIQGHPLTFAFADDGSNPQTAVQLASGLIAKGVPLMLGPSLVASCRAVAALVEHKGPVDYCLSTGIAPENGSYEFVANFLTLDTMKAMMRYFRFRGFHKLAYMVSTDAGGQDGEENLRTTFNLPENRDLKIIDVEHFNTADVSVSAQVARIKAAAPDAIIVWTTGTPAGTVFRALSDAGVDLPVGTSGGNLTFAQMEQYAAILPKQLYLAGSAGIASDGLADRDVTAAATRFRTVVTRAGGRPDQGALLAWDVALMVTVPLHALGPAATADQIHDYLERMRAVGAAGRYDFGSIPQRGLAENSIILVRWDQPRGRWVAVSKPGGSPL
jgi:branched-chain amino acid transport system substrate-binding protein